MIEEMGGESSDEDHPLSNDSDCISEDFTKISKKIIDNSQIKRIIKFVLNGHTKQCAIYFYSTGDALACASCMISLADLHIGQMYATRKHVTEYHDAIDGSFCSSCRNQLFLIVPCARLYVPVLYTKRHCCE